MEEERTVKVEVKDTGHWQDGRWCVPGDVIEIPERCLTASMAGRFKLHVPKPRPVAPVPEAEYEFVEPDESEPVEPDEAEVPDKPRRGRKRK